MTTVITKTINNNNTFKLKIIMKNYISISNQGLITPEDITLIGSSTKRGNEGKIGQFGSGWKFALAWILRNDLDIKIFSGNEEIVVDFAVKMHRDNPVKILTVNGAETSITSGMGEIDWKGWMALREIVSNAIDEGDEEITTLFNPRFNGVENKTTIFIEMNGELADILRNFNSYFSFERKAIWSNDLIKIYKKEVPSQTVIFRKGIRCWELDHSLYDFDFTVITINESRLSSDWNVQNAFREALKDLDSPTILLDLLKSISLRNFPSNLSPSLKECMIELAKTNSFIPKGADTISMLLGSSVTIPDNWYKELRDLEIIPDVFAKLFGKASPDGDFYIREDLELESKKATYYVSEYLTFVDKVVFVKFLEDQTLKVKGKTIYISDDMNGATVSTLIAKIIYHLSEHEVEDMINVHQEISI